MPPALALHTWTLDTTPLDDVLRVARATGWDAVELRRLDFTRAADRGRSADEVVALVRASRLPVACVGVEPGWLWAGGTERARLLAVFTEQCGRAATLGAPCVMSSVDRGRGELARAAASVREVGDIAAGHGLRLALEFNSQAEQVDTLARAREVLGAAGHPACGLLLDTYHLWRSAATLGELAEVPGAEIAYVQFSDVPRSGLEPGRVTDRLPPGQGLVPFREFFALVLGKGYAGPLSYEAPNPAAWARPPEEVAREALAATRTLLPG